MNSEDVEALCAPIEKIVNYEYSSRDTLIHNCDLGPIDIGQLQDLCAALRALLAERDAAFAAGQEEMRERAAKVVYKAWQNCHLHDEVQEMLVDDIRELPIKPRPEPLRR